MITRLAQNRGVVTSQDQVATALIPPTHAKCIRDAWKVLEFTNPLESPSRGLWMISPTLLGELAKTDRVHEGYNQGAVAGSLKKSRVWHCFGIGVIYWVQLNLGVGSCS